jgi:hypothetical protein
MHKGFTIYLTALSILFATQYESFQLGLQLCDAWPYRPGFERHGRSGSPHSHLVLSISTPTGQFPRALVCDVFFAYWSYRFCET